MFGHIDKKMASPGYLDAFGKHVDMPAWQGMMKTKQRQRALTDSFMTLEMLPPVELLLAELAGWDLKTRSTSLHWGSLGVG
jgi:hypothetical protein